MVLLLAEQVGGDSHYQNCDSDFEIQLENEPCHESNWTFDNYFFVEKQHEQLVFVEEGLFGLQFTYQRLRDRARSHPWMCQAPCWLVSLL